jgi:hypothetical protein
VGARLSLRMASVVSGVKQLGAALCVAEEERPDTHLRCSKSMGGGTFLCTVQDRPSIRYIRDVVRMRSSNFIEMRFVRPTAELMAAMEAAGAQSSWLYPEGAGVFRVELRRAPAVGSAAAAAATFAKP